MDFDLLSGAKLSTFQIGQPANDQRLKDQVELSQQGGLVKKSGQHDQTDQGPEPVGKRQGTDKLARLGQLGSQDKGHCSVAQRDC